MDVCKALFALSIATAADPAAFADNSGDGALGHQGLFVDRDAAGPHTHVPGNSAAQNRRPLRHP